jgi:adenylate cyclase
MLSRGPRVPLLLGVAVVLWVGWTAGWPGPRWRLWERGLEDQLQLLVGVRRPPPGVLLVPVDDATLQVGDWFEQNRRIPVWARGVGSLPWPRAAYGETADRLLRAGAAAVAINVVFEGPSSRGPADDQAFALLLRRHPGRIALAAEMLESEDSRGAGSLTLVRPELFLPALGGAGALGLTNILARRPGEPSFHPEAYARGLLGEQEASSLPSLSTTLLRLAGRQGRQDDSRSALNVYGPEGTFPRLSAWEVLDPDRWRAIHAGPPSPGPWCCWVRWWPRGTMATPRPSVRSPVWSCWPPPPPIRCKATVCSPGRSIPGPGPCWRSHLCWRHWPSGGCANRSSGGLVCSP